MLGNHGDLFSSLVCSQERGSIPVSGVAKKGGDLRYFPIFFAYSTAIVRVEGDKRNETN